MAQYSCFHLFAYLQCLFTFLSTSVMEHLCLQFLLGCFYWVRLWHTRVSFLCLNQKLWNNKTDCWIFSFGTTAGSHRLFTHRTYRAKPLLRWFIIYLQTMAGQEPIYRWVWRKFIYSHIEYLICMFFIGERPPSASQIHGYRRRPTQF